MYIRSYTMQDEQHKNFLVNFQHVDFGSQQSFQQKNALMIRSGPFNSSNNGLHQMVILQLSSTKRPSFFRSVFGGRTNYPFEYR